MNVKGRAGKWNFDFIFIFCSTPALTGYFFSFFDFFVLFLFLFRFFYGGNLKLKGAFFACFCLVPIIFSGIFNSIDFSAHKNISYFFLLLVLFSVYFLIEDGFFTAKGALNYWALGLIPGFFVILFQQFNPGVEFFNFNDLKSNPIPGMNLIRGSGLLYNPNSFAEFSIICFIYFLHVNNLFMVFVSFFSALLTFSKTFFLIPVLFIFYCLAFLGLRSLLMLVFFFVFGFLFMFDFLFGVFENRILHANSLGSRIDIISYYFNSDYSVSKVLVGNGAFSDVGDIGRIHNKIISVFYQFGILGFVCLSIFYFYPFFNILRRCVPYDLKVFSIFSLLAIILISMVSTFTFFSFDYVIVILILAYVKENSVLKNNLI